MSVIQSLSSHISQRPAGSVRILEIHGDEQVFETYAVQLRDEGLCMFLSGPYTQAGQHVWLEFKLNESASPIRVLSQIDDIEGNQVYARFVHMWPRDERRYQAHLSQSMAA